jgi:hypothetical protein
VGSEESQEYKYLSKNTVFYDDILFDSYPFLCCVVSFAIHQLQGGEAGPGVVVGGTDRRIVDRQSMGGGGGGMGTINMREKGRLSRNLVPLWAEESIPDTESGI